MDNWYKVTIHDNPITRENVIFEGDSRKIYKITFNGGRKDLVRILSEDLYINLRSILTNEGYKLDHKDFVEMLNNNMVEDLDVNIK